MTPVVQGSIRHLFFTVGFSTHDHSVLEHADWRVVVL